LVSLFAFLIPTWLIYFAADRDLFVPIFGLANILALTEELMKSAAALITAIGFTVCLFVCCQTHGTSIVHAQASTLARDAKDSLQEQIVAKEREGLDALGSGNLELFGKLTAEEAVMVDAQGAATKAQVLKNVAELKLTDYSMDDLKFVPVS
jgi:hypothetical protein